MKECELCNCPARLYCESDQASLCGDCDSKVHSANFLVARHSRTLLCHTCQSHTPWKASGPRFGPTVSVCNRCFTLTRCERPEQHHQQEQEEEGDGENETEEDEDLEDEDDTDDEEEEEEEDGENQVVPWSSTPPPLPSSSSSEDAEDSSSSIAKSTDYSLKRKRENADLSSQDDLGCSSSRRREEEEETSIGCFRPLKDRKMKSTAGSEPRSDMIDSIQRFQKVRENDDEVDICKLSGDHRAVDLVSTVARDRSI